ncbi:MAG TPA: bifunctional precorrin-2 dehydrogenase/sirohydrochlorin ferrochelatase [Methylomirabilota bacterium]|jgi:precorrin-2 dehydrogenase/sirohydrochlorin ferrochelatase|nr:bifunctional precorrin-2 dehydrogenase/sirohydrochlorin ferrochelatase [Methylomirabilota bacterium]
MGFYPVSLDLTDRPCVVIGGGVIAERRVAALLEAGASVTLVSPSLTVALASLADAGRIRHVARGYERGDLAGAALVLTAVDDPSIGAAAAAEARERAIWVNAADDPANCDFILPGLVRRGVLTVAVGSGGASPALTRALREHLDATLGVEWAALGELASGARLELRAAGRAAGAEAWRRALGGDVRALLAEGRIDDARERLRARLDLVP